MSQSQETAPSQGSTAQSTQTTSSGSSGPSSSSNTPSTGAGMRSALRGADYASGVAALTPIQMQRRPRHGAAGASQAQAGQQAATGQAAAGNAGTTGQAGATPAPDPAALAAARQRFRMPSMRLQTMIPLYFTARQNPYPPAASAMLPYLLQLETRILALDDAHQIGIAAEAIEHNVADTVVPAVDSLRGANGDVFGQYRDHAAGALADTLSALGSSFQFGTHAAAFADANARLQQWNRRFFIDNGPPDAAAQVAARTPAPAPDQGTGATPGTGGAAAQSPGLLDRARNALSGPAPDPDHLTRTQEATHAVHVVREGIRDVMILLRTYDQIAPRVEVVRSGLRNTLSWIEGPGGRLWTGATNSLRGPSVSTPGPEISYTTHLLTAAHVMANIPAANAARDAYMADRSTDNALAFANAMGNIVSQFGASMEDMPPPMRSYAQILSRCNGQFFSNVSRLLLSHAMQADAILREADAENNAPHRGM